MSIYRPITATTENILPMREIFVLKMLDHYGPSGFGGSLEKWAAYVYKCADALMAEAQRVPAKEER